ncbi:YhcN/YlaJ family sporulation lipoprotein [Ectobacillus polymachus]|uniref:YhcN/YlaJ family sporulation lipoprotein n=1 Tax=Ectobacillus polymachus TaxID=1508806 RepID=UPI003A865089
MHKKTKLLTIAAVLAGTLTACTTAPKNTAMDQGRQTAQDTGYTRTSYQGVTNYPGGYPPYTNVTYPTNADTTPNYGEIRYSKINRDIYRTNVTNYPNSYAPSTYSTNVTYPTNVVTAPNYGDVRYSKINQDIHRKQGNVAYNYYTNPTPQANFYNANPTRNANFYNANPTRNVTMNGYDSQRDRTLAEDITNRITRLNEVGKGATIVKGNDVLVAILPRVKGEEKKAVDAVSKEIAPITQGRNVKILSDEASYNKVQTMSTNLLRGTMTPSMRTDMDSMFRNVM